MTAEERGKEIFLKWNGSSFVSKEIALIWLESEKKKLCAELENGFYKAEMAAVVTGSLKVEGTNEQKE